jgi:hypothetical protein
MIKLQIALIAIIVTFNSVAQDTKGVIFTERSESGITLDGEKIYSCEKCLIENIYFGWTELYRVTNAKGKMAVFNLTDQTISPFLYDEIDRFEDVLYPIDAAGKWIASKDFESTYNCNGIAFEIIETTETMRTTHVDFTGVYSRKEDSASATLNRAYLAAVRINDKWGIIDQTGVLRIEAKFTAKPFLSGDFNEMIVGTKRQNHIYNCLFERMYTNIETIGSNIHLLDTAPNSGVSVFATAGAMVPNCIRILNSLGDLERVISYKNDNEIDIKIESLGDLEFLIIYNQGVYSALSLFDIDKGQIISGISSRSEMMDELEKWQTKD